MDHLCCSLLNTFTAQPLDRVSLERKDPNWLAAKLAHTGSEYLILDGHNVVTINRVPLILSYEQFHSLKLSIGSSLLGLKKSDNTAVYLVNITEPEKVLSSLSKHITTHSKVNSLVSSAIFNNNEINENVDAVDVEETFRITESLSLREIAPEIAPELASMYSYAMILNHWHINTRFCNRCGSSLEIKEGGTMQQCSSEPCNHIEYPRINPAVIMRVTKGNKILLARQENWTEHMYSVLAGFVEVGETLEHAVEREVMEEVNIPVKNIHYHSSQPWPFPNSFMLGYTAEATSDLLDFEKDDIEHALWLTADEMKLKMTEGTISPPTALSISYNLIDDWFQKETGTSLKEFRASLTK